MSALKELQKVVAEPDPAKRADAAIEWIDRWVGQLEMEQFLPVETCQDKALFAKVAQDMRDQVMYALGSNRDVLSLVVRPGPHPGTVAVRLSVSVLLVRPLAAEPSETGPQAAQAPRPGALGPESEP